MDGNRHESRQESVILKISERTVKLKKPHISLNVPKPLRMVQNRSAIVFWNITNHQMFQRVTINLGSVNHIPNSGKLNVFPIAVVSLAFSN